MPQICGEPKRKKEVMKKCVLQDVEGRGQAKGARVHSVVPFGLEETIIRVIRQKNGKYFFRRLQTENAVGSMLSDISPENPKP